jgi:hypothetical protein
MGNVRIHNRGQEPFSFNTPGFRLMGLGGYLDSQMKCPENEVPAGGMLQVSDAYTTDTTAPVLDMRQ